MTFTPLPPPTSITTFFFESSLTNTTDIFVLGLGFFYMLESLRDSVILALFSKFVSETFLPSDRPQVKKGMWVFFSTFIAVVL
ncbi:unnamed protein product [Lactuca virosa]|uniref:Uncharacterized protein n=1 Tax=Lactuca virosa TaxID=75947 RepID=A0AAU9MRL5_9ASTR|nr:unnamed protein product [Lactuca virosa]